MGVENKIFSLRRGEGREGEEKEICGKKKRIQGYYNAIIMSSFYPCLIPIHFPRIFLCSWGLHFKKQHPQRDSQITNPKSLQAGVLGKGTAHSGELSPGEGGKKNKEGNHILLTSHLDVLPTSQWDERRGTPALTS